MEPRDVLLGPEGTQWLPHQYPPRSQCALLGLGDEGPVLFGGSCVLESRICFFNLRFHEETTLHPTAVSIVLTMLLVGALPEGVDPGRLGTVAALSYAVKCVLLV